MEYGWVKENIPYGATKRHHELLQEDDHRPWRLGFPASGAGRLPRASLPSVIGTTGLPCTGVGGALERVSVNRPCLVWSHREGRSSGSGVSSFSADLPRGDKKRLGTFSA